MKVKSKKFKDRAKWLAFRSKYINSTEIAALFGCSPYTTLFELWHTKQGGAVVSLQINERMKWGSRLQKAIAEGIAEDHAWALEDLDLQYAYDDKRGLGSSFDYKITENQDGDLVPGLLEIKNVDSLAFKEGWLIDGDMVEAPLHIEFQIQHQLLLSGASFLYLGALVGGNKPCVVKRVPDIAVQNAILEKTAAFWKSIKVGSEPKPDFKKDAEFISQLYFRATPGKVLDKVENDEWMPLVKKYYDMGKLVKEYELEQAAVKAELLVKVGDNEKVRGENFSISAGMVAESKIEYMRKPYRLFKVNFKGE